MSAVCTKDFEIAIPDDSLVAYWKFDEAAGATRADSTPNGNTLSTILGVISSTTGVISNALRLNFATGPLLSGLVAPTWNNQSITMAGWIRQSPGAFLFNGTKYTFSGNIAGEWGLSLEAINNDEYQGGWLDELGNFFTVNSGVIIVAGGYDFVVLELDFPNLTIGISVNGSALVTAAIPASAAPSVPFDNGFSTRNTDASGNRDLDEMGIWYRKLTPAEIAYLYNGGAGRTYPDVPSA